MTTPASRLPAPQVLGLDPSRTSCIGDNQSKPGQCGIRIAEQKRREASTILEIIGQQDVHNANFDPQLLQLAKLLLCASVHGPEKPKSQVSTMVERWKRDIARFQVANQPNLQDTLEPSRDEPTTLQERHANTSQLLASNGVMSSGSLPAAEHVDLSLTVSGTRRSAQTEEHQNPIHFARTLQGSSSLSVE
ncbi:MAG: hypothetical protein Q9214_008005, partial [Letrouitia sp. 1 TL-2023]